MFATKNLLVILLSLLCISASAQSVYIKKSATVESRNGHNYFVHQVEKGQTVYSIAKAYDVSVDEIYFENPTAKNGLTVGQEILIPTVNKETQLNTEVKEANYEFFYHIAAANETLAHIASIYVIPVEYIRKANPTLHDPLREGEYVKVPVEGAFNALDGKSIVDNAKSIPETYVPAPVTRKPQPKPASKAVVIQTTEQSNPETKVQNSIPAPVKTATKPAITKTQSEFVSFDPNIPVISDYRHVVVLGESTQSIASKYDIPVDILKAANPGLGNSVIKGDRLRIPDKTKLQQTAEIQETITSPPIVVEPVAEVKTTPTAETNKSQEPEIIKHTVKKKETLYGIGREYGVTVDEIKAVNPGLTNSISIGQIINIPKKKIDSQFIIYQNTDKTRLKNIAKMYQMERSVLEDDNPALGKWVFTGQTVKVRVGESAQIMVYRPSEPEAIDDQPVDAEPAVIAEKIATCPKNAPHFERTFKIALLLPLYLEDAENLNKTEFLQQQQTSYKPFRFLGFYEGALMAIDSLKKLGVHVELFVYDVDQTLSKAAKVLQQPELRTMDLIIGPFFPQCFQQVALFAGTFSIPIVNPLTFRGETAQSYKSAIKVKPGPASQESRLANYLKYAYPNAKVFFITQSAYEDAVPVQNMMNTLLMSVDDQAKVSNTDLYNLAVGVAQRRENYEIDQPLPVYKMEAQNIYPNLLKQTLSDSTLLQNNITKIIYMNDSLHPFLKNASAVRQNVVILYGNKKSFVLDVINRINESRDTFNITLIGLPTWERLSDLNNTQLSNLKSSYFSTEYIDYESVETQDFIWKFRQQYSTEPDTYGYLGYDLTYYFLYNLFLFGDKFNDCLESNPMKMLQTTYHFKREYQNSFENTHWNLLKYNGLNLYKIPDAVMDPLNSPDE